MKFALGMVFGGTMIFGALIMGSFFGYMVAKDDKNYRYTTNTRQHHYYQEPQDIPTGPVEE